MEDFKTKYLPRILLLLLCYIYYFHESNQKPTFFLKYNYYISIPSQINHTLLSDKGIENLGTFVECPVINQNNVVPNIKYEYLVGIIKILPMLCTYWLAYTFCNEVKRCQWQAFMEVSFKSDFYTSLNIFHTYLPTH